MISVSFVAVINMVFSQNQLTVGVKVLDEVQKMKEKKVPNF